MTHSQNLDRLAGVFLASSLADANGIEFCARVEEVLQAHDGDEISPTEALWHIRQMLDLMKEYNARLRRQID